MNKLVFLFCSIIISIVCRSQSFYFRHYEVEHGLSNNTVIAALQDRNGFMWFGTSDGLNRFDGNAFKVYKHSNLPGSIGSNAVYCLHEDRQGNLWIGTEKGLFRYNAGNDNFEIIKGTEQKTVRSIFAGEDGTIWLSLQNKLTSYNINTKTIAGKPLPGSPDITIITRFNNEGLLLGTADGKIIHLGKNVVSVYNISQSKNNSVESVLPVGKDLLLIGCSGEGLKKLNIVTGKTENLLDNQNTGEQVFVRNILQASNNNFFINTENGLYVYNETANTYKHIYKKLSDPYSLSDNALYALCRDREGGIWIGSYFGGINYLPHQYIAFEKYFATDGANTIGGRAIREIVKDIQGNFWIGSEDGGLTKYIKDKGLFIKYYPDKTNRLSTANIHGLMTTGNKLYIGTFEHGLDIMDINTGRVVQHFNAGSDTHSLKSNFINKIIKTTAGEILLCTANGVFNFDTGKNNFNRVPGLPQDVFYSAVTEDHNGTIWIGSHNRGLFFRKKNVTGLFVTNTGENPFSATRIIYIMQDADEQLWVCTTSGAWRINLQTRKYQVFNSTNGFPSDIIYGIVPDADKNLWFPTSQGLVYMNKRTGQLRIFRQANGLLNNQFNYQSIFKDTNGDIYLGSIKGLIRFNPALFQNDSYVPPLYITGLQRPDTAVQSYENSYAKQAALLSGKITLPHDQSTFSIEFAALCYTAPENILYEYKINNSGWYRTGNNKRIFFTNLSPGTYHLTIRSTNSEGIWMPNEKSLAITITPPWWKSDIAYALYTICVILLAYFLLRLYTGRQKEKQRYKMQLFTFKKEKELYQSKMDFFTNVTHEIKTPLTLIKVPLERVLSSAGSLPDHLQKHLQIMNGNTQRLLELTNQLLDFRKTESDHYNLFLTDVDITAITMQIWNRFLPVVEQKKISYRLDFEQGEMIVSADTDAITKIISNLADNAIKYCRSHICIKITKDLMRGNVLIAAENDGPLVPAALREKIFEPFFRPLNESISGTGIGLSLAHSLAALHKGSLNYTVHGTMNVFLLSLPLKGTTV